jgi:hypothetical protein
MSDEEVLNALPHDAFRALLLVPGTPDHIKEAAREKPASYGGLFVQLDMNSSPTVLLASQRPKAVISHIRRSCESSPN